MKNLKRIPVLSLKGQQVGFAHVTKQFPLGTRADIVFEIEDKELLTKLEEHQVEGTLDTVARMLSDKVSEQITDLVEPIHISLKF